MSGPAFLDPEVRRVLLEEIAFQRSERDRWRAAEAAETVLSFTRLRARLRAEGCTRTIRAVRDIWHRLVSVQRVRAEDALAAGWTVNETTETYG